MKSPFHIFAIALLFALAARADSVYYVSTAGDDSNTGLTEATAFRNPQTAIDKADGTAKVTVKIVAGTYTVKTFATDPAVINITNSNVSVEAIEPGKVIVDGGSSSWTASSYGGKLYNIAVMTAASLENVRVSGIVFQYGSTSTQTSHGVDPVAATAYLKSGFFEGCKFYGSNFRYCSQMWLSGSVVASNCTFASAAKYGSTGYGYGDYLVVANGGAQILDSTLEELWRPNKAPIRPMLVGGTAVISNSVIRNTCFGNPYGWGQTQGHGSNFQNGEAIIVMDGGSLIGCTVTNNVVYGPLRVLKIRQAAVTAKDNVFWKNDSKALLGNILIASGKTPTVTGNVAPEYTLDTTGNTSFEPWQEFCTSNSIAVGKAPFKVRFRNRTGDASAVWDFGDGSATVTGATPEHTYSSVGKYTVKMTLGGKTTTRTDYIVATGPKMYVSKTGTPEIPYDTAAKAAAHPQDAVDLAPDGAGTEIIVDDGTYTARTPAKDDTIIEIQKSGVTLRAKNGPGRVWLNSQRTIGNGISRSNMIVGKSFTDILVDGFVMTNGWVEAAWGPSCAMLGSGVFTNCAFDIYRLRYTGGVDCNGTAHVTCCRVGSVAQSLWIESNNDYALGLAGSACCDNTVVKGVNVRSTSEQHNNPAVRVASASSYLRNCLVTGCKCGGVNGTGGRGAVSASAGTIENCTIVNNSVTCGKGGGLYLENASVVVRNNIIWGNTAPSDADCHNVYAADYSGCTYSASPDLDATSENHNVKLTQSADPGFTDAANGDYTLKVKTLLTGTGVICDWMTNAVDLAGLPRLFDESVSMGAYEPQGRSYELLGDFSVTGSSFGPTPLEISFSSTVTGGKGTYYYKWDFGDGTVTDFITNGAPTHTYSAVGGYSVSLTVKCDKITSSFGTKTNLVSVVGDTCYLRPDQAGTTPYDTWEKATSNIEAAVALKPNEIVATNGTYYICNTGDKYGIKLDRAMTVRSVEGPEKTTISRTADAKPGSWVSFHVATLTHEDAVLDGFSLARAVPPAIEASAGLAKNCIVTNCQHTFTEGLVALSGTAILSNCVVDATGQAFVGCDWAAYGAAIRMWGSSLAVNCEFRNVSRDGGDGLARGAVIAWGSSQVRNCYIHDISYARGSGGSGTGNSGIIVSGDAVVDNCTVTRCWANQNPGGAITTDSSATIRNCLFWGNTGYGSKRGTGDMAFDIRGGLTPRLFSNCLVGASGDDALPSTATDCLTLGTDPLLATNGPAYRLQKASPCVDAGQRLEWCWTHGMAVDIEGRERRRREPDIGCWEFPNTTGMIILFK